VRDPRLVVIGLYVLVLACAVYGALKGNAALIVLGFAGLVVIAMLKRRLKG
jgi:hypothetical protein